VYRRVADELRASIVGRPLPSGRQAATRQIELAEMFSVSRSALCEASIAPKPHGPVDVRVGTGIAASRGLFPARHPKLGRARARQRLSNPLSAAENKLF
jgi:DNA-binding FadR family transcriptional regulator